MTAVEKLAKLDWVLPGSTPVHRLIWDLDGQRSTTRHVCRTRPVSITMETA